MLDGKTKLVGLLGWPVEHSFSPLMHNAAFDALGLNWRYLPLAVHPAQVGQAVRGLAALGLQGANVTIPHKQAVMAELDDVRPQAALLGAVNTIIVERDIDGQVVSLQGDNTDERGFINGLTAAGFDVNQKQVVMVGAGGAARAVAAGLLRAGAEQVVIFNRNLGRAKQLIETFSARPEWLARLLAAELESEKLIETVRQADLLVNATSLGQTPSVEGSIWPGNVSLPSALAVYDLVYNPVETKLLQQAKQAGALPIDGLEMLVRQGALSFEMWTGEEAPLDVMRAAISKMLSSG